MNKIHESIETEQDISTDIPLYAIVDEKDMSTEDIYTEVCTNRTESSQSMYSAIHQEKKTESVPASKSLFESLDEKNKLKSITISKYWLCLIILAQLLLLIISLSLGVIFYYTISKSDANQGNFNSSHYEEFMKSLSFKFEYMENNTLNNSLKISAILYKLNQLDISSSLEYASLNNQLNNFYDINITNIVDLITNRNLYLVDLINQLNRSSTTEYSLLNDQINKIYYVYDINITNILDLISHHDLHLVDLVNQLNMSTSMEHASLNERINQVNHLGKTIYFPAPSCQAIYLLQPYSMSGYYWVTSSDGSSVHVYCEMTKSCGNITGGLTRVALLNSETRPLICTGDFVTVNHDTLCVRNTVDSGCSQIVFPLMNISYSHMCGTVEGYWFGSPDGFIEVYRTLNSSINDNYVDGISLTYGNTTNRNHIWTFIADGISSIRQNCPREIPEYVGNSYSCLIWDGLCPSTTNPCSHEFFRQIQEAVTEDIEMRLCRDQSRRDEGIYVGNLEVFVW